MGDSSLCFLGIDGLARASVEVEDAPEGAVMVRLHDWSGNQPSEMRVRLTAEQARELGELLIAYADGRGLETPNGDVVPSWAG